MEIIKSNIANKSLKIISSVFALLVAIVGVVFFKADVITIGILMMFMLFYVLIPGLLVFDNIKMNCDHISTRLARSFFIGFALNVILYYLSFLTGLKVLLYFFGPCMSALWLFKRLKAKTPSPIKEARIFLSKAPASFYVFFALVFLYSVLTTQCVYISPEFASFSTIKLDFGFHAGIVNSLSSGYPPANPWVYDRTIHYHYFSELLLSIPVYLFNLNSEEVLLSGTPFFLAPVLTVSMYSFFREYAEKKNKAGLYCLAAHVSNMFILKSFPNSWFLYHIYSNINNTGLGISCLFVILPIIKSFEPRSKADSESNSHVAANYLVFSILIMLLTGVKGPIAAVLVGGMIGTMILEFVLKGFNRHSISITILASISFTLIYVYVLGSQHSSGKSGSVFNLGEVTDLFFLKSNIQDYASSLGIPKSVTWIALFFILLVFYLSAFLVPFVIGYLRELFLVLSKKKEFSFSRVNIYACCAVGFLAMMILNFSGHSQVYFGFATLALVPMVSFWYFEDSSDASLGAIRATKTVFAACMLVSILTTALYIGNSFIGAYNFYNSKDEDSTHYRNVSTKEYEGLIWIKENTADDSLIASDRYYSVSPDEYSYMRRSNNNHFAYAIYSQRNHYLEGSGFSLENYEFELRKKMIDTNNLLYLPDNENRGELARDLGVDYVIVSKRFNKIGSLANKDYNLCFSNNDMDIYEIKVAE